MGTQEEQERAGGHCHFFKDNSSWAMFYFFSHPPEFDEALQFSPINLHFSLTWRNSDRTLPKGSMHSHLVSRHIAGSILYVFKLKLTFIYLILLFYLINFSDIMFLFLRFPLAYFLPFLFIWFETISHRLTLGIPPTFINHFPNSHKSCT